MLDGPSLCLGVFLGGLAVTLLNLKHRLHHGDSDMSTLELKAQLDRIRGAFAAQKAGEAARTQTAVDAALASAKVGGDAVAADDLTSVTALADELNPAPAADEPAA